MKICEICEKTEACVEVKRYENGEMRELSLCAHCAQKNGLSLPPNLADLLLDSTLSEVAASSAEEGLVPSNAVTRCPLCRMRLSTFRKTGRLGCPACYTAWCDVLEPMLIGMHHSDAYKGTIPTSQGTNTEPLKQALAAAVAREDYEEAARLRDQIRETEEGAKDVRQEEFSFDENS